MLLHRPNQRALHIISPCHNTLPLEVKQTLTFLAFCLSKITKSLQFRLVSNYAAVSFMRQSCFMRSCDNSSTTLSHRVSQKNFLKDSLIIGPVITRSEQPKISHGRRRRWSWWSRPWLTYFRLFGPGNDRRFNGNDKWIWKQTFLGHPVLFYYLTTTTVLNPGLTKMRLVDFIGKLRYPKNIRFLTCQILWKWTLSKTNFLLPINLFTLSCIWMAHFFPLFLIQWHWV